MREAPVLERTRSWMAAAVRWPVLRKMIALGWSYTVKDSSASSSGIRMPRNPGRVANSLVRVKPRSPAKSAEKYLFISGNFPGARVTEP